MIKGNHKQFLKQDIMALVLLHVISLSLISSKEANSWHEMFPSFHLIPLFKGDCEKNVSHKKMLYNYRIYPHM